MYKNLAPNPAFRSTSGDVEIYRNLVRNPRMKPGSGFIGVQKNRFPNPRGIAGGGPLVAAANNNTVNAPDFLTGLSGLPHGITTAARIEATNPGTWWRVGHQSDWIKVQAGRTYTFSAWATINNPSIRVGINVIWRDASGANIGEASVDWQNISTWTRLSVTHTAPANADHVYVYVRGENNAGPGNSMAASGFMVDEWPTLRDYVDGSTASTDPDLENVWEGTPNASFSLARGQEVTGIKTTQALAIWSQKFGGSLRVIPTSGTNSYAEFTYPVAPSGDTTALATMHLEAPIAGILHERALSLIMLNPFTGVAAPNVAGSYPLRHVDASHNTSRLILWHGGAVGSGDVYWTDVAVFSGTYTGDFFDGDTGDHGPDLIATWSGAPNDSESVLSGKKLAGVHATTTNIAVSAYQTTDELPHGEFAARYTIQNARDGTLPVSQVALTVGETYTVKYLIRSDIALTLVRARLAGTNSDYFNLTAGEWREVTFTGVAASNHPATVGVLLHSTSGHRPGSLIDIRRVMLVPVLEGGEYTGPYRDGSFPGWEWEGTPNASGSIEREIPPPFIPVREARSDWDLPGERQFQAGCEKGMLYSDGGTGVPWNGLTAVKEGRSSETVQSIYQNGIKISESLRHSEFVGTVEAFTYPDEFSKCIGEPEIGAGFFISEQTPKPFHMSYVTRLGDDLQGDNRGYRLHLVYNALANPTGRDYATHTNTMGLTKFVFPFTTKAERLPNNRPASHIYFDSDKTPEWFMNAIETILYGTSTIEPTMPAIDTVWNLATMGSAISNQFSNPKFNTPKGSTPAAARVEVFKNFHPNPTEKESGVNVLNTIAMPMPTNRRVYIRHLVRSTTETEVRTQVQQNLDSIIFGEPVRLLPNQWTEVVSEFSLPLVDSNLVQAGIISSGPAVEVKQPVYSHFPTPYFDPYKPSTDSDLTVEWTGDVGDSPSVMVGRQPAGFQQHIGCVSVISNQMPGRETSLRVIKTSYEDEVARAVAAKIVAVSGLTAIFESHRKLASVDGKVALSSASVNLTIFDAVDQPSSGGIKTYRKYSNALSPLGGVEFKGGRKPGESMWYYGLTYVRSDYYGPIIEGPVITT